MARPPKYNATIHKEICDNLRLGCSRTTAAELAGIDRVTLQRWCESNVTFCRDVQEAIAAVKRSASMTIRQSFVKGDVQSAFRYLSYQERQEWSDADRTVNVNVNITLQAIAEKIAADQGLDPAEVMAEAERILKVGA